MLQLGGEGGTPQYGGWTTYLSRGPCWRAFQLFEVFGQPCIIFWQNPQCVQNVIQWYFPGEKELKPLWFAKHKENWEHRGWYPNQPRIDRKYTNHLADEADNEYSCCLENRSNRVSRWTRKSLRANAPTNEVKQWMLSSMCYDCPHKIFTHMWPVDPLTQHNTMIPTTELSWY